MKEKSKKVQDAFMFYTWNYDVKDTRVQLKIIHTARVIQTMINLCEKIGVSDEMQEMAEVTAILHDIGRFEQLKRYDTFNDAHSCDHAALSVDIVKEEHLLDEFDEEKRNMIMQAVAVHNRLSIPEEFEGDQRLLSELIRDADKLDIFRVFAESDMEDMIGKSCEEIAEETISDVVYQSIKEHRSVKKTDRKTSLDIWVGFLGFIFDLNFKESFIELKEKMYYRKRFDETVFTHDETRKKVHLILEEIEQYIDYRSQEN